MPKATPRKTAKKNYEKLLMISTGWVLAHSDPVEIISIGEAQILIGGRKQYLTRVLLEEL